MIPEKGLALPGQRDSIIKGIWHEIAGGKAPLLTLKMEGALCKGMQVTSRTWEWPQLTTSKETGTQVFFQREINSAKNLNVFGSRFSHNASRKEYSWATPDLSLFNPECWTHLCYTWTPDLQRAWDNKWILFEAAIFVVICYTAIESYYQLLTSIFSHLEGQRC